MHKLYASTTEPDYSDEIRYQKENLLPSFARRYRKLRSAVPSQNTACVAIARYQSRECVFASNIRLSLFIGLF